MNPVLFFFLKWISHREKPACRFASLCAAGKHQLKKEKAKKDLLQFAGSIDQDDLELMEQAIADGCEKIDADDY